MTDPTGLREADQAELTLWETRSAPNLFVRHVTSRPRLMLIVLLVLSGACIGCASVRDGVLDVSWTAPTANVDGSAVTGVAAYRVYYGTASGPCPGGPSFIIPSRSVSTGQIVTTRLTSLKTGELYYVVVTAVSATGVESPCSDAATGRARRAD